MFYLYRALTILDTVVNFFSHYNLADDLKLVETKVVIIVQNFILFPLAT